jgi:hypothetical protein
VPAPGPPSLRKASATTAPLEFQPSCLYHTRLSHHHPHTIPFHPIPATLSIWFWHIMTHDTVVPLWGANAAKRMKGFSPRLLEEKRRETWSTCCFLLPPVSSSPLWFPPTELPARRGARAGDSMTAQGFLAARVHAAKPDDDKSLAFTPGKRHRSQRGSSRSHTH